LTAFSDQIKIETKNWQDILVPILDTVLFLGERGLAFWGDRIEDKNNGYFL